jgi:hypothetical protein
MEACLCQNGSAGKVTQKLRESCIDEGIAGEYFVHPDIVIKDVSRNVTSNLVNVISGGYSFYGDHASSGEACPIEILCREKAQEAGPKLFEDVNRVWGDEYTIVKTDNGGG